MFGWIRLSPAATKLTSAQKDLLQQFEKASEDTGIYPKVKAFIKRHFGG